MRQLLVEHAAGRISGERRPALLDCTIDDLKILLDDRYRRRIELSPPLAYDVLEHVDLSSIHEVGMRSISFRPAHKTGGRGGPIRGNVDRREARGCAAPLAARDTEVRRCCSRIGSR